MTEELGRISGYGGRLHTPILDEDRVVVDGRARLRLDPPAAAHDRIGAQDERCRVAGGDLPHLGLGQARRMLARQLARQRPLIDVGRVDGRRLRPDLPQQVETARRRRSENQWTVRRLADGDHDHACSGGRRTPCRGAAAPIVRGGRPRQLAGGSGSADAGGQGTSLS